MAANKKRKKRNNVNNAKKAPPKKNYSTWIIVGIVALCAALAVGIYFVRSRKTSDVADPSQSQLENSLVIDNGGEGAGAIAEESEKLEDAMEGFSQFINGNEGWQSGGESQGDGNGISGDSPDWISEGGGYGGGGYGGGGYGGGSGGGGSGGSYQPAPTPTFQPLPIETISFPYDIPGTGLTIEQVSPYSGYFLEDGSGDAVSNVMTIVLKNNGGDLSFAGIGITHNDRNLAFTGSNIPAGATVIIQEQNRAAYYDGYFYSATATTTDGGLNTSDSLSFTDNGNNTFTVTNTTEEDIESVVISYKSFLPEEDVYVGGITYTVNLNDLGARESVIVDSSHYVSGYSVILSAQAN